MSDIIKLLPETVANQIAAGEIVPEPSYIVKELLENSIDAGSTKIQVLVVEGGRNLIQITDNGKGMSPTDARMAFERHATSKISCVEDLDKLHTMGFRGEALNAISSIAQVELRTRPEGAELGTKVCIKGGEVTSVENCVCPVGTTFVIMDIFFNLPVRRRALSKMSIDTVYKRVKREFERVALVNPHIAMSLTHDKKLYKDLLSSTLKERILAISSKRTRNDLLPIHSKNQKVKIDGFIGKPDSAKQGANQYFFVNNRYMEHLGFKNAIIQTFKPYLLADENSKKEPNYYIYFEVEPESIDVNISPMKTDVRFLDEELIEIFLRTLIRSVLSANAVVPTIDFNNEQTVQIPPSVKGYKEPEDSEEDNVVVRRHVFMGNTMNKTMTSFNPSSSKPKAPSVSAKSGESNGSGRLIKRFEGKKMSSNAIDWQALAQSQEEKSLESSVDLFGDKNSSSQDSKLRKIEAKDLAFNSKGAFEPQSYCLFKGKYLLTTTQEELLLIDVKRAYQRVFYERFKGQIASAKLEVASLMFPEQLSLSSSEQDLLFSLEDLLKKFGFTFCKTDEGLDLLEAPSLLRGRELETLELILSECQRQDKLIGEDFLSELLGKKSAELNSAEYAKLLSEAHLSELLKELFSCEEPSVSPSGESIIKVLSEQSIQRFL